jgi:prevent-host-death family protein
MVAVPTVTVRELARNTAAVIQDVESSGRPALVTRNGRPVAALVAVDQAALEEWLLSRAPEFGTIVAGTDADPKGSDEWAKAKEKANDSARSRSRSASESPPEHLRGSHRGD